MLAFDIEGAVRWLPVVAVLALAGLFARTLWPGQTPLIERIARVGLPAMPHALRRYTRRLTVVWSVWFLAAAIALVFLQPGLGTGSVVVWAGTVALFIGEHLLRPLWFPDIRFPGLIQQLRDTWRVWRRLT
ncbi:MULTISPECIES: hypothetical protein [Caldimonas]|jgi:uncharacterized membrane protein|uniref:hypothetical protein n=1 Tax=Caldimonas TaxID=196013 RepID=UPI000784D0BA|nr:hypothetical protein [Caldimonas taiwanensis]MCX7659784.1 hypothetical protein [Caldimonas manganoxidans]